jgi:hypothetical protein
MIQLTPQSRIFWATEPVDCRTGIDGLAAVCRQRLVANPLEGAVYGFRPAPQPPLSCCCMTAKAIGS